MQFRLLGPLVVRTAAGEQLPITRSKHRLLLVALLIRANTVVSRERLIRVLWGEQPPASARANLSTYVSSLRRLLCPADPEAAPLRIHPHGYAVEVTAEDLDVLAFETLLDRAEAARRAGRLAEAAGHLTAGLSLWRGTALEDVPTTTDDLAAAVCRWQERRLTALEQLADVCLATGRHAEVIEDLASFAAGHPLRERLTEQLMLALCRDGRPNEALAAYQRLRDGLVEELGVEPAPRVRTLQRRILSGDPGLSPSPPTAAEPPADDFVRTPRQLPLDIATFVGRDTELRNVTTLLAGRVSAGRVPIVVIHGAAGVGKSALAVRAATSASAAFPDGQLYLDLRGATAGMQPLTATEALGRWLRALGVPGQSVPADPDEGAALFRSLVAGRRLLFLLDNAAGASQVRPLLPGGGSSAVLVTSRENLAALDGSVHVHLGPLDPAAAHDMLRRLLGDGRMAADPQAGRDLAGLCGLLPLGLHVAAARLKARPAWTVRHLAGRMADERDRLTELSAGDLAVRSSLGVSVTALRDSGDPADREAARAFCVLGVPGVADTDADLLAALLDATPSRARRSLDRLGDAHLVEAADPGRYRMHDLIRLFAAERAGELAPADRSAAFTRALEHYIATAGSAARKANPHRVHYPLPEVRRRPADLPGQESARAWLERERPNMTAMIEQAWTGGPRQQRMGMVLALNLHWFLILGGHSRQLIDLDRKVLELAERLGEPHLRMYAHDGLALGLIIAHDLDNAAVHLLAELSLSRELGDRFAEQRALGNLGSLHLTQHRPEPAIARLREQLAIARQIGATAGERFAQVSLGRAYRQLGRNDEAIDTLRTALERWEAVEDGYLISGALVEIGQAYLALDRPYDAVTSLRDAVTHAQRAGTRLGEAWALTYLARAWRLAGHADRAMSCADDALSIMGASPDTGVAAAARAEREMVLATTA
nr:BTAD domain-containing putative transcriptional regulator [uncultured Actinoplanes sp.]